MPDLTAWYFDLVYAVLGAVLAWLAKGRIAGGKGSS